MKYILVSPVYNEEKYIRGTIESVINQTILPMQWIIISDASTDKTDQIINEYTSSYPFITFVRFVDPHKANDNNGLGKVSRRMHACISEGLKYVNNTDYFFIGNLDGDVTFGKEYYEQLINKFGKHDKLGLGGGYIYNVLNGKRWSYFTKSEQVGGPIQFFRKECWEQIGGYFPGGHLDYFAVAACRKFGWEVQSFPELEVLHHKNPASVKVNHAKVNFHLGQMDYVCGEILAYAGARYVKQIKEYPILVGSAWRLWGFLSAHMNGTPKQVPPDLKEYLEKQQIRRLLPKFIRSLVMK